MADIFISYASGDKAIAQNLSERLKEFGHKITTGFESLGAGDRWQDEIAVSLKNSEVFVALISRRSVSSQWTLSEFGAARAYAAESGRTLIIPVALDDVEIPANLREIKTVFSYDRDLNFVVESIQHSISEFIGRRAAKHEKALETAERIKDNVSSYVDVAIEAQRKSEVRNRVFGIGWYSAGFLALVGGIFFALLYLDRSPAHGWEQVASSVFKSIVLIGFLAACARYAFSLGKSYISESLKCADRVHAIEFGKFYLQAYGETATWMELGEVFQHWNIDRVSTFSALDVSAIDPQILSLLGSVANAALGKKK